MTPRVAIRLFGRSLKYDFGQLDEVSLVYGTSIHKSQGLNIWLW